MNEKIDIDDGFSVSTFSGTAAYQGTTTRGVANVEEYEVSIPALGLSGLVGEWDGDARHNVTVRYTGQVRRAMRRTRGVQS